jgi:hypothetical protein
METSRARAWAKRAAGAESRRGSGPRSRPACGPTRRGVPQKLSDDGAGACCRPGEGRAPRARRSGIATDVHHEDARTVERIAASGTDATSSAGRVDCRHRAPPPKARPGLANAAFLKKTARPKARSDTGTDSSPKSGLLNQGAKRRPLAVESDPSSPKNHRRSGRRCHGTTQPLQRGLCRGDQEGTHHGLCSRVRCRGRASPRPSLNLPSLWKSPNGSKARWRTLAPRPLGRPSNSRLSSAEPTSRTVSWQRCGRGPGWPNSLPTSSIPALVVPRSMSEARRAVTDTSFSRRVGSQPGTVFRKAAEGHRDFFPLRRFPPHLQDKAAPTTRQGPLIFRLVSYNRAVD